MRSRFGIVWVIVGLLTCRASETDTGRAPRIASSGQLQVRILLAESFGEGVQMAARDLVDAMARIAGVPVPEDAVTNNPDDVVGRPSISVTVTNLQTDELGAQGYRLEVGRLGGGSPSLAILARSEIGAMYALYQIAADLGVRYFHPEETFYPDNPDATLPWYPEPAEYGPDFARRGFHEHTQHPIPAADFLLNPDWPGAREQASRYLKWLARNRQNTLTFHLLKTVDKPRWIPYIRDVVDEAHRYGIRVGVVVSFMDRQQNAYRLLDDSADPGTEGEQIRAGLDELLDHVPPDAACPTCPPCPDVRTETGLITGPPKRALFDFVGLQFGTSEFTTPTGTGEIRPEDRAVAWLDTALAHLKTTYCQRDGLKREYRMDEPYPYAKAFAWIHTPCGVKASDGSLYFHLPLRADPDLGVFVHTTMFYDMDHPAPVYGCQNFHHQKDFLGQAAQQRRPTVYFPETAWWLGFDNNLPLLLPVTGRSREHDLRSVLPRFAISAEGSSPAWRVLGHVTFTTGREWTYWQYDHFLTRATWREAETWNDYLDWIAPMYGEAGSAVATTLRTWTDIQVKYFYEVNPSLFFYLAGELPQDEAGAAAGVIARPPKLPFSRVFQMDDDALASWKAQDLDRLVEMRAELGVVFESLPDETRGTEQNRRLFGEVRDAMRLFLMRLDHAVALYSGVMAAREWRVENERAAAEGREPDASVQVAAKAKAEARLGEARAITDQVRAIVAEGERRYREPLEQVARPRPDNLTAYKFGYLWETSTAYFWSRRDEQLASLIADVFGGADETWKTPPAVVYVSDEETTEVLVPGDEAARTILRGFIPTMLWGFGEVNGALTMVTAQDHNQNGLPDPGTEVEIVMIREGEKVWGQAPEIPLVVRDGAGNKIGLLSVLEPRFDVRGGGGRGTLPDVTEVTLEGVFSSMALIQIVVAVTGGGIDEEGIGAILKDFYELDAALPLPELLPFAARFAPRPAVTAGGPNRGK